jgi:hypothetical protein
MTTKFSMARDIGGFNGFGLLFSDTKYNTTLAANTAQSLTVPSVMGMGGNGIYSEPVYLAIFSYAPGSSVWVANNATAAVPGGSFAAATSELNPAARQVNGGDVLSFITADTSDEIGVTFYVIS